MYSGDLISLTLNGWHHFTNAGVRLKQTFSFSNVCPGLNPGPIAGRELDHSTTATPVVEWSTYTNTRCWFGYIFIMRQVIKLCSWLLWLLSRKICSNITNLKKYENKIHSCSFYGKFLLRNLSDNKDIA